MSRIKIGVLISIIIALIASVSFLAYFATFKVRRKLSTIIPKLCITHKRVENKTCNYTYDGLDVWDTYNVFIGTSTYIRETDTCWEEGK